MDEDKKVNINFDNMISEDVPFPINVMKQNEIYANSESLVYDESFTKYSYSYKSIIEINKTQKQAKYDAEKAQQFNLAYETYISACKQYEENYHISLANTVFENPHSYFYTIREQLFTTFSFNLNVPYKSQGSINQTTLSNYFDFLGLPYSEKDETIMHIINSLKILTSSEFINKENIIMQTYQSTSFKNKLNQQDFLVLLLSFFEYLCIIDKNICVNIPTHGIPNMVSSDNATAKPNCISSLFFEDAARCDFSPLKRMVHTLWEIKYNSQLYPNKIFKDTATKEQLHYYNSQYKSIAFYYDKTYDNFLFHYLETLDLHNLSAQKSFKKFQILNENFQDNYIPKNFIVCLTKLTGGNIKLIDEMAILFAKIIMTNNCKNNMTKIYSPLNSKIIIRLFTIIFNENIVPEPTVPFNQLNKLTILKSFTSLCQKKNIRHFAQYKLDGKALCLLHNAQKPSDYAFPMFLKMIKGTALSLQDDIQKISFSNNFHLLHIIDDLKYNWNYESLIQPPLIDLNGVEQELNIDEVNIDKSEIQWIQTRFALHGLKRMVAVQKKTIEKNNVLQTSTIIEEFINACCSLIEKAECSREDMYTTFNHYYEWRYKKTTILTAVTLAKEMKKISEKIGFEYRKVHHYKEIAHQAYVGIKIDDKKIEALKHSQLNTLNTSSSNNNIEAYFANMNSYMPSNKEIHNSSLNPRLVRE